MRIKSISHTRRKAWNQCKLQYYYNYEKRLPADYDPPVFQFGRAVHYAAEQYVKARGEVQLIQEFNFFVAEHDIQLTPEHRDAAPKSLMCIKNLHDVIGYEGFTEERFVIDYNGINIVGVIDRLVQWQDNWWLLDYKTGSSRSPDGVQLKTYVPAAMDKLQCKPEEVDASFLFLSDGETFTRNYTQKELDKVLKMMYTTFEEIRHYDPDTPLSVMANPGFHCKWCNWRKTCPFYKTDSIGDELEISLSKGVPSVTHKSIRRISDSSGHQDRERVSGNLSDL